MTTDTLGVIKYAVIIPEVFMDGFKHYDIRHLYHDLASAKECVHIYKTIQGCCAILATLDPPVAVKSGRTWFDLEDTTLHTYNDPIYITRDTNGVRRIITAKSIVNVDIQPHIGTVYSTADCDYTL